MDRCEWQPLPQKEFIHKDPKAFTNIFNRSSDLDGSKVEQSAEDKDPAKINHLKNYNLAIIVF